MNKKQNNTKSLELEMVYQSADKAVVPFVLIYFAISFILAPLYNTWIYALIFTVFFGVVYSLAYFIINNKSFLRYFTSAIFFVFPGLFLFQTQGNAIFHMLYPTAGIILLSYQSFRIILVGAMVGVLYYPIALISHTQGYDVSVLIYNLEQDNMSLLLLMLHTFPIIVAIATYLSTQKLRKGTLEREEYIHRIDKQTEILEKNKIFAKAIANNDLEADCEVLENDELGEALKQMQKSLKEAKQKDIEEKFYNVGLAEVSDILRNYSHDIRYLSDKLIAKLVKYLNANQGAVFILEDDHEGKLEAQNELRLDLKASYAYERKKFQKRTIVIKDNFAEGLIGQVFLEKELLYLDDIPQNYIHIGSGLGGAVPSFLLIIPLKIEDDVEGVIEIASFHPFEDYEIDFVEKITTNIASSIKSAKVNERTKFLLELSQQQNEAMRAQDEEMRQNMEELQATQEAMRQKQAEIEKANKKMKDNETILRKSFEKAKEQELKLKEANAELAAREEEMRQNMEELQATQEAVASKQKEAEEGNRKLALSEERLKKAFQKAKINEAEIKRQNESLKQRELELEENQNVMDLKQKQMEKLNQKLQTSETILRKALEKANKQETELKEQNEMLKSQEEAIKLNMGELLKVQDRMKKQKNELEKNHHKLITLINAMPDLIFYKNMEGVYVECNKAFGDLLAKHPTEIIGMTDYDLFSQEIADFLREKDKEMLDKKEKMIDEEWVTYPNQQKVLLETIKFPFISDEGETIGIIGMSRNITEKKIQEERILDSNRKMQVNEQVLKKAYQKMKKQKDEMKNKQEELELLNQKFLANQNVLEKALKKARFDKKQYAEQKLALHRCEITVKELQQKLDEKK